MFDLPNMFMLNENSSMSERCYICRTEKLCETNVFLVIPFLRKHNLEMSGSPISGRHRLWDCWSEEERTQTVAMVLKVSQLQLNMIVYRVRVSKMEEVLWLNRCVMCYITESWS